MRRCSVFECFDQEAEFLVALFRCESEYLKHLCLKVLIMNSYRASAELNSVKYDIVCVCLDLKRIGIEKVQLIQLGTGKRMMHSFQSAVFLVLFEHREINDPEKLVFLIIKESHTSRAFPSEEAEGIVGDFCSV